MSEQQPSQEPQSGEDHAEQEPKLQPKIYAASLADYNAGRLHGAWIDAAQPAEDLHADISAMVAASPEPGAEEWAIHDYEGFGPLHLDEYESIDYVAAIGQGIAEHGPAFAAWAHIADRSDVAELQRFEDCYQGQWESAQAYADDYVDGTGINEQIEQAAGPLAPYVHIDTEALARDMALDGFLTAVDDGGGGVFIFDG